MVNPLQYVASWQNGKFLAVCSYDQMKSRTSRIFQSLGYCYKSLDVWGVEYCIILHEKSALKDEGDGIFYSYCVFENFTWWFGFDDAQIENWVRPQMHLTLSWLKTYHQTLYLSGYRRPEETWLFKKLPFSNALGFVCCSCSNLSIIVAILQCRMAAQPYVSAFMTSSCSTCFRVVLLLQSVCVFILGVAPFCLFYLTWLIKFLWEIW